MMIERALFDLLCIHMIAILYIHVLTSIDTSSVISDSILLPLPLLVIYYQYNHYNTYVLKLSLLLPVLIVYSSYVD